MLIILSCKNSETEYFSNGKVAKEYNLKNGKFDGLYKEFYEDGRPKAIYLFQEGEKVDSSIFYNEKKNYIDRINYFRHDTLLSKFYYENGQISHVGEFFNNQKIGKWTYYKKNGNLERIFEYKTINGKQYTNQGWYFDAKGDTIKQYGSYFYLKPIPKSIKLTETVDLNFKYKPLLAVNADVVMYTSTKINADFSNLDTVHLNKVEFFENEATIKMSFKSKGKKNMRGYIEESITTPDGATNSKNTYFDIPIDVK